EKGAFVSALYCRDTNCTGLAVPEITGLPHPNWNCLVCKQKSTHAQMVKAQDFASGAISSKFNSKSLKSVILYLRDKSASFIPDSNYAVIDAKLQVIARLAKRREDCGDDEVTAKAKFCEDILEIMDKLGLGDCLMRTYLETEKAKEVK
ncbi:PREDICTED: protein msta-like, partial [Rhagoletis zephyria]